MNLLVLALIGVAGGLGACARYGLDVLLKARFPRIGVGSTALINVTGSVLLGLIAGLSIESVPLGALSPGWTVFAGNGFLGGYTTFSTASVEAVQLAREGRWGPTAASAAGVLITGTGAAAAGLWASAVLV